MENLRKLAGKWVYVLPRGYALAPDGNKVQAVRQQIQSGRNTEPDLVTCSPVSITSTLLLAVWSRGSSRRSTISAEFREKADECHGLRRLCALGSLPQDGATCMPRGHLNCVLRAVILWKKVLQLRFQFQLHCFQFSLEFIRTFIASTLVYIDRLK